MYTWWAFVRTDVGAFMKVTVQADTQYNAMQMLRNMYGTNLCSEAAMVPK
jgi:hypothetical protein